MILKLFFHLGELVLHLLRLSIDVLPLHVHQQPKTLRVVLVGLCKDNFLEDSSKCFLILDPLLDISLSIAQQFADLFESALRLSDLVLGLSLSRLHHWLLRKIILDFDLVEESFRLLRLLH